MLTNTIWRPPLKHTQASLCWQGNNCGLSLLGKDRNLLLSFVCKGPRFEMSMSRLKRNPFPTHSCYKKKN